MNKQKKNIKHGYVNVDENPL